jgi:hypothetical protein
MYQYIEKDDRKVLTAICESILHNVQDLVRDYFTFEIKLIGSGEKRLITQNGATGYFDLDYNIILKRDKMGLISNPEEIRKIFLNAFNKFNPQYGFKYAQDSTSVITSRLVSGNQLRFSFDIAILSEGNNGNYYKLIYDKVSQRYIWNEVRKSRDYAPKFKAIKEKGYWLQFKKRYLELKNAHLRKNDGIQSFSIFLETINEFYQ